MGCKDMFKNIFLICCLLSTTTAHAQLIRIDGSSTVFPITEAVAEDFQTVNKNKIKVTVGISGTGGGFKKFCRNEIDISNASRTITEIEKAQCKKENIFSGHKKNVAARETGVWGCKYKFTSTKIEKGSR